MVKVNAIVIMVLYSNNLILGSVKIKKYIILL